MSGTGWAGALQARGLTALPLSLTADTAYRCIRVASHIGRFEGTESCMKSCAIARAIECGDGAVSISNQV